MNKELQHKELMDKYIDYFFDSRCILSVSSQLINDVGLTDRNLASHIKENLERGVLAELWERKLIKCSSTYAWEEMFSHQIVLQVGAFILSPLEFTEVLMTFKEDVLNEERARVSQVCCSSSVEKE